MTLTVTTVTGTPAAGNVITGKGIQAGTYIVSVAGSGPYTVTLSAVATVMTGTTVTCYNVGYSASGSATPASTTFYTDPLSVTSTQAQVQAAINKAIRTSSSAVGTGPTNWYSSTSTPTYLRGVIVTRYADEVNARNGWAFLVRFLDEGTRGLLVPLSAMCDQGIWGNNPVPDAVQWTLTPSVRSIGASYGMTALQAGVANGIIQRGNFLNWYVTGDAAYTMTSSTGLKWNALPEPTSAVVKGFTGTSRVSPGTSSTTLFISSVISGSISTGMTVTLTNPMGTVSASTTIISCAARAQVVVVAGTSSLPSLLLHIASTTTGTVTSDNLNGMTISFAGVVGSVQLSACAITGTGASAAGTCTMSTTQTIPTGTTATATAPEVSQCTLSAVATLAANTTLTSSFSQPTDSVQGYLQSISARKVRVTRSIIGKYGVVQWEVKFIYNPGQTPPGSGNIASLTIVQDMAADGQTYSPVVYESAQGSEGITGYFTVDLHDPIGPRKVWYNQNALSLERKLNELTTIGLVHVDKYQFPNSTTGGWGAVAVDGDTKGGYEWKIRFTRNPGNFNGNTFPPGSGNIDPLTVSYTADNTLFGANVEVQTVPYVDGSVPIDGTFTLSLDDHVTDPISYAQQPIEAKYLLESLPNVGVVSTTGGLRMMQPIPGIFASASKDSQTLFIEYDTANTEQPADIRQMIASGDVLRFGGLDAATLGASNPQGVDGGPVFGTVVATPQSPILQINTPAVPIIYPGEQLRIGADNYKVLKTGSEVQVLSVTCTEKTDAVSTCFSSALTWQHNGVTATTSTITRFTTAAQLQASFDRMPMVDFGDVVVTRSADATNVQIVFSIYFQGDSVKGDVNQLAAVNPSPFCAWTIMTMISGGFTEVQRIRVNVESGYISGPLFRLTTSDPRLDSSTSRMSTLCFDYGASAMTIQNALNALPVVSSEEISGYIIPAQTAMVTGPNTITVWSWKSIYGIIQIGSILHLSHSIVPATTREYTYVLVTKVLYPISGRQRFVTNTTFSPNDVVNTQLLYMYLAVPSAIQVARYGTGNSTATVVTITQTADSYVTSTNTYFQIRMVWNGDEKRTTCLPYRALASDVQTAINSMGFDFHGDGTTSFTAYSGGVGAQTTSDTITITAVTAGQIETGMIISGTGISGMVTLTCASPILIGSTGSCTMSSPQNFASTTVTGQGTADSDHVTVTRDGDGLVSSGYGFVYTLRFAGPSFKIGRSEVMGRSLPVVQIIEEGSLGYYDSAGLYHDSGSCTDLDGTAGNVLMADYATSVGLTTWQLATAANSTALGRVQAGQKLRIGGSSVLYTVVSQTDTSITVDKIMPAVPILQTTLTSVYSTEASFTAYSGAGSQTTSVTITITAVTAGVQIETGMIISGTGISGIVTLTCASPIPIGSTGSCTMSSSQNFAITTVTGTPTTVMLTTTLSSAVGLKFRYPPASGSWVTLTACVSTAQCSMSSAKLIGSSSTPVASITAYKGNMKLTVTAVPIPEYTVETPQQGEDSYTYEIFYTGRHSNKVVDIEAETGTCYTSSPAQLGGMRYGVQVQREQIGGSDVVEEILISSQSPFVAADITTAGFFKLVFNSNNLNSLSTPIKSGNGPLVISMCSSCLSLADVCATCATAGTYSPYTNVDPGFAVNRAISSDDRAAIIKRALTQALSTQNIAVEVSSTGYGSAQENYAFRYKVTFLQSTLRSGAVPLLAVLGDKMLSAPLYLPANQTTARANLFQLNDLSVSGSLNASNHDMTFFVRISGSSPGRTDSFVWMNCTTNVLQTCADSWASWSRPQNITAGTAYPLGGENVRISFAHSAGHFVGDVWTFVGVRTSTPLPTGSTIYSRMLRAGVGETRQITVDSGFTGTVYGAVTAFKVPPTFAVEEQQVQIIKITTNYNPHQPKPAFYYRFAMNESEPGFGAGSIDAGLFSPSWKNHTTHCLAWNAEDYEVQAALVMTYAGICAGSNENQNDCISVVRTADNTFSQESGIEVQYTYSIYFEDSKFAKLNVAPMENLNMTKCDNTWGAASGHPALTTSTLSITRNGVTVSVSDVPPQISQSVVQMSTLHTKMSASTLPLASASSATTPAFFRGPSVSRQPLYKVNGNLWAVTFASNLGDIDALVAAPTKYLSSSTSLAVYDNVVQGEAPTSFVLGSLDTGVDYSVRVAAYTRGANRGYGNYSDLTVTSVGTPSGVPPALQGLSAVEALAVPEVQSVILGAAHVREVQTITTAATSYSEVQRFQLSAPTGKNLATPDAGTGKVGKFALRFPEVQTIEVRSTNPSSISLSSNYIALTYTSYQINAGAIISTPVTTACVALSSSSAQMKAALESAIGAGTLEVMRSGYGGYKDYYGYTWSVSFVGNAVAGNVAQLVVAGYGTSASACATALTATATSDGSSTVTYVATASTVSFLVSTISDNQAVGLDTEVHTLTHSSAAPVAQGQYKLNLLAGSNPTPLVTTACLAWNATASDMQAAFAAVQGSWYAGDKVYVERYGNASAASSYGYTYSIYFTANMFHLSALGTNAGNFSISATLATTASSPDCPNNGYSYFASGVMKYFNSASTLAVSITDAVIRPHGYSLQAAGPVGTSAAFLKKSLKVMPSWVAVDDVRRTLADDQNGYQWTVVFGASMGNVNSMVCGMDTTLSGVTIEASCGHYTSIDGNFIGGYFIVGTSALLPSSVSASGMQAALQVLSGVGSVAVTRSNADFQGGYTWTVTWLTATGNQPPLAFSSSLTGSGVTITGSTLQDGNYLGGTYALQYQGKMSASLAFNATGDQVAAALLPLAGGVSVMRGPVSTEGGSEYVVTFTGISGDLPALVPVSRLTGMGATARVITRTQGAASMGNAVKVSFQAPLHCSHSQVPSGTCGAAVDSYAVEIGPTGSATTQVVAMPVSNIVQTVRVSASSLFETVSFTGDQATGYFRLSYNGHTTNAINAQASALDVRDALEALPDIDAVAVSRTYAAELIPGAVTAVIGAQEVVCAVPGTCPFATIPVGEIVSVGGEWYRVSYRHATLNKDRLELAQVNDSSILASYGGAGLAGGSMFRWARGYEWAITFLAYSNSAAEPLTLASPAHGLNPMDSAVSIRTQDCVGCAYITGLTVWHRYYLQARAHNHNGYGPYAYTTGQPKEIPGAPASVVVMALSSTSAQVAFTPPAGDISDISMYSIEWDSSATFSNVLTNVVPPSASTYGYGRAQVTGAAISLAPPYKFIIPGLTDATVYYVRVSARNSVTFQQTGWATNQSPDVTKWSSVSSAKTSNQRPSAPLGVTTTVASPSSLQVVVMTPLTDGGKPIDSYLVEWDASAAFADPATYGNVTIPFASLTFLDASAPTPTKIVYTISGLSTGKSYYVQVSAKNSIGSGPVMTTTSAAMCAGKSSPPATVFMSTPAAQATPITTATVQWTAPSGADSGSAITGYLVEWWQGGSTPEIQAVQWKSTVFDATNANNNNYGFGTHTFTLKMSLNPSLTSSPSGAIEGTTGVMYAGIDPLNVRNTLMNLGQSTTEATSKDIVGNVAVTRSIVTGVGLTYSITFLGNAGNLPNLHPALTFASSAESISNLEIQPGQREGGLFETQVITITNTGASYTYLGGYFALSFNGTQAPTSYIPVATATGEDVRNALNQLTTLSKLPFGSVTRTPAASTPNSIQWVVTFADLGNQPAIAIDASLVFATYGAVSASVDDGSNALTVSGSKAQSLAYPGELPVGYHTALVDKDARSFTVPGLVPGTTYYATVSAVNKFGASERTCNAAGGCTYGATGLPALSATPPKQAPSAPNAVSISVHPGTSGSSMLDVSYAAPASDGGTPVLKYRVELDTDTRFTNPIHTEFNCPTNSKHSIFAVTTYSAVDQPIFGDTDPIRGRGKFGLQVKWKSQTYDIDNIPYDAVAMIADEVGVTKKIAGITAQLSTTDATAGQSTITTNGLSTVAQLIFVGDRLQFVLPSGVSAQSYPHAVFQVLTAPVCGGTICTFDVSKPVQAVNDAASSLIGCTTAAIQAGFCSAVYSSTTLVNIFRYNGGRGDPTGIGSNHFSRVLCMSYAGSDQSPNCPAGQLASSGSMQGKIQSRLPIGLLPLGVEVSRDEPDKSNGITWRITFLDASPTNDPQNNFDLSCWAAETNTAGGVKYFIDSSRTGTAYCTTAGSSATAGIIVTKLMDGSTELPCTGTQTVPGASSQTLVMGTAYYARVFAVNEVGYSLAQLAVTATGMPAKMKPMVAPGPPASVGVTVAGPTSLRVEFTPPSSDGGDVVTQYKVEYSTSSDYRASATGSVLVTYIQGGGATLFRTLTGLTQGTPYFVRVSAFNSQGFGLSTTAPAAVNPSTNPDGPSNVVLRITSQSMLTVSFGPPASDGGDAVTHYLIEWDITALIGSGGVAGQKGSVRVSADSELSYTLTLLSINIPYYVRVSAINGRGQGTSVASIPAFAAPSVQVPGRPHSILATPGQPSRSIQVSWQYPRIPWHGIPCTGSPQAPNDCPTDVSGGLPVSAGGSAIISYLVSYNELPDFSGLDGGEVEAATSQLTLTLTDLTSNRLYYIRVLARNAQGSGPFCAYSDANCLIVTTAAMAVATA